MGDEIRRVLALLAENKVTVDEADQLVRRFTDPSVRADATPAAGASLADTPRFIRIQVQKPGKDGREPKAVNIRVPLSVVRGGLRLSMMIPGLDDRATARLREGGMDVEVSKLDPAALEAMLSDMGEINIDIDGSGERVRITTE